jgi:4,5-DOPA dioxygenase extradiol
VAHTRDESAYEHQESYLKVVFGFFGITDVRVVRAEGPGHGGCRPGEGAGPRRAIVASGSMTHNLYEIRQPDTKPESYAQEFAAWVRTAVQAHAVKPLINYRTEAPRAARAHPTQEHFLPLLVALGAQLECDSLQVLDGGITHGVLSMESYVWGMAP